MTKPKVSEWEKEFDKKLPPGVETWSEETPYWLAFEGLCNHDDSFFCKHRRNYVKSFIQSLLDQQKAEMVEMVRGIKPAWKVDHRDPHAWSGSAIKGYVNGLNQAIDDIIKRLEEF